MTVYLTGLALGFSLIVAIGAQNAFVLRQGIKGEHVFPVCLVCALSDAVLIFFGVTGFQVLSGRFQWLTPALRYGGAAFLIWYGILSFRSALKSTEGLTAAEPQGGNAPPQSGGGLNASAGNGTNSPIPLNKSRPLKSTILICLALTWLNPHVYLDTVVMLGMLSSGYPGREIIFAAGAVSASFIFFFALGYGAAFLRPWFEQPKVWRVFEFMIGLLMLFLAAKLLLS